MNKVKFCAYCNPKLWKDFLKRIIEKKGKVAISQSLEEAIRLWLKEK